MRIQNVGRATLICHEHRLHGEIPRLDFKPLLNGHKTAMPTFMLKTELLPPHFK